MSEDSGFGMTMTLPAGKALGSSRGVKTFAGDSESASEDSAGMPGCEFRGFRVIIFAVTVSHSIASGLIRRDHKPSKKKGSDAMHRIRILRPYSWRARCDWFRNWSIVWPVPTVRYRWKRARGQAHGLKNCSMCNCLLNERKEPL